MPTRFVKDSAKSSETLWALSDFAVRLFWHLITECDDWGRFEANPKLLLSRCFPLNEDRYSVKNVFDALIEMYNVRILFIYKINEKYFGCIINSKQHFGQPRARKPKYPEPSNDSVLSNLTEYAMKYNLTIDPSIKPHRKDSFQLEIQETKEDKKKRRTVNEYTEEFEEWWKMYPPRHGMRQGKLEAFKVFVKLSNEKKEKLKVATENYINFLNGKDVNAKDPVRFLRNDKFIEEWFKPEIVEDHSKNGKYSISGQPLMTKKELEEEEKRVRGEA